MDEKFSFLLNCRYCADRSQNLPGPAPNKVLRVLQISSESVHFLWSYSWTREHRQKLRPKVIPIFARSLASSRITRRHTIERTPPPRHTEIGTVSLPASRRCIGLNFPALPRNWFPIFILMFDINWLAFHTGLSHDKYLEYVLNHFTKSKNIYNQLSSCPQSTSSSNFTKVHSRRFELSC